MAPEKKANPQVPPPMGSTPNQYNAFLSYHCISLDTPSPMVCCVYGVNHGPKVYCELKYSEYQQTWEFSDDI